MTKIPQKQSNHIHRKRYGHHQKRTKKFHNVYLPYLPLVVAIIASVLISGWSPRGATLAYATNTSVSGLLSYTNSQRSANGKSSLSINSQLNNAAQAKANDMVARDYWSHNTPDGKEPWVFFQNAGYKYAKAGENLAYGFLNSSSTITGWMNSPSHKANMLDGEFKEVGFGFANSANFNDSGPQTVVVAMYGKPQTLASTNEQAAAPTPSPAPTVAKPTTKPVAQQPTESTPTPTTTKTNETKQEQPVKQAPFTTEMAGLEPVSQDITRVAAIAGPNGEWAVFGVGLMLGLCVMAFLTKHLIGLRKLFKKSELFVLHHPLFDSTVLGLIIIGITLLQTTGVIK
jgi:uncharacterized protein YkwD